MEDITLQVNNIKAIQDAMKIMIIVNMLLFGITIIVFLIALMTMQIWKIYSKNNIASHYEHIIPIVFNFLVIHHRWLSVSTNCGKQPPSPHPLPPKKRKGKNAH